MPRQTHAITRDRRSAGFSLAEVLVALAVFTLGFVAVAALLPSGALLQRETTDDVRIQHANASAEATLKGVGREIDADPEYNSGEWQYRPVPNDWLRFDDEGEGIFTPADRTSPGSVPAFVLDQQDDNMRRYEWIPLIRDANGDPNTPPTNPEWWMVAVILRLPHGENSFVPDSGSADPDEPPFVEVDLDLDESDEGATWLDQSHFEDADDFDNLVDNLRVGDRFIDSMGLLYRIRSFSPADAEEPEDILEIELNRGIRFGREPEDDDFEPPDRFYYVPHPDEPGNRPSPLRGVTAEIDGIEIN